MARFRLAWLWLSQAARAAADWSLRMFVVLSLARAGGTALNSAWHLATAVFIAPFILLAPFNGAISNGLPKRWVLVGSCAFCLAVAASFVLFGGPGLLALGLVAAGTAVYSPTRYALLPAAAADTDIPLTRVNALIEMGGAAAIVLGILLTAWPGALVLTLLASAAALLAAVPVRFATDISRPEPLAEAIVGFFRDCRRIAGDAEARGSMLGLACFLALVTAGSGVVLSRVLESSAEDFPSLLVQDLSFVLAGVATGALLAGLQGHLRRGLGLVPLAATGLLGALAWAAAAADQRWPCLLLGMMAGIISVPLRAFYQAVVPAEARGNAMAVFNFVYYLLTVGLAGLLLLGIHSGLLSSLGSQLWFLAVLAALGVVVAWRALVRETLEQALEIALLPVYRIHACGPGLRQVPSAGPVIVIGNHAAWLDPLWVGKVIPRRLFPMMTSLFFDRPVLHWLMTNIVHAIRVPVSFYRREAPELKDAIAVLDRGDALLLFPEGMMRRKEERPLRNFGQGIWRILRERPDTPIVMCWIEGGWGSVFSYFGGPPLKNKRMDWWRRIDIAVAEPLVIDPALLEEHRTTRLFLMRRCVEARKHLGLSVPATQVSEDEEDEQTNGDARD